MMPRFDTSPTVGLMPTKLLHTLGDKMLPEVSVPTATTARFAAMLAPEPLLEPPTSKSPYGLSTCPPRLL